ncbi:MAG: aldehyde ferredoxin oxidoreductase family protein [Candidatus Krumholzibacteriota bacterium]|nr:aldehyde ferredoxin oxidoreductase family protein [Candidatus Krumholzibacteriota bacterium]
MNGAYMGKFLSIDLTKRKMTEGKLDPQLAEEYVGGKGMGLRLLRDLAPRVEALSPENPLIFVTGPLTGTLVQTSARSALVTKSPLTNGFLDSHAGGHFGPALKRAGYDYVIIRGKASRPVYLHLSPGGNEIIEAGDLWGKGIFETEKSLREKYPRSRVASIGPAGENLALFACIGCDLYRQFGRGGAGAVMGSKNLKALVIQGRNQISYFDDKGFKELNRKLTEDVRNHPNAKKRFDLGTMMWIRMGQETGEFLPTRNFQKGQFEEYEKITAEAMKKELNWKSVGCFNCVIRCSKMAHWDGMELEGPEYETTAFLGSGCEINDPKAVALSNLLCDDLGLDTISMGVTCSFAMECYEKGLLKDTDGLELNFGNAEAQHELIKKIAYREGIGDLFADGTRLAGREIGQGSDYFAINTYGMELSGVNIKGCMSMGLALATSDFASHTRLWTATDEMNDNLSLEVLPKYVSRGQDDVNIRNSLVVCDFLPYGLDRLAPLLSLATGFEYTPEKLMHIGERIHNLARLYNLDNGRTGKDDTLPERFFQEEMTAGILKGQVMTKEFFDGLVQRYYQYRGWDKKGVPGTVKLGELGLG